MQATLDRLRQRRDERGDEGGFTLIELLIVIVILAILAAIVVFAVQNLTGSSAKASCESDLQTVDHAIQAYVAQVGKQPAAIQDTATGATDDLMPTTQFTGSNGDLVGPWLHNVPTNGTHYSVVVAQPGGAGTTAYAAVVTPGSPTAKFVAGAGSDKIRIYEPNGVADAGALSSATTPVNAVSVTTSDACLNVTS